MAGPGQVGISPFFQLQAVVGQEAVAAGGEAGRQRGLALPRKPQEGDGEVLDFDGSGMQHELELSAQGQRQHLVAIEVVDRLAGNPMIRISRYFASVGRNGEIGYIGEAKQVTVASAVEAGPGCAVREGPLMERHIPCGQILQAVRGFAVNLEVWRTVHGKITSPSKQTAHPSRAGSLVNKYR